MFSISYEIIYLIKSIMKNVSFKFNLHANHSETCKQNYTAYQRNFTQQ